MNVVDHLPNGRRELNSRACVYCTPTNGEHSRLCVAHMIPQIILRIVGNKKKRVTDFLEHRYKDILIIPTQKYDDLIFIRYDNWENLVPSIRDDIVINRAIISISPCVYSTKDINELSLIKCNPAHVYKLQVFPRKLTENIIDNILPSEVNLDPKNFTHLICITFAYERYHYAIVKKEILVSDKDTSVDPDDVISRAYHKIAETFAIESSFKIKEGMKALDVGASPGGWSSYLAMNKISTLSIDPGDLQVTHPLICHIKKRIEDCFHEIELFGPIDILVCDMNIHPLNVAKTMLQILPYLSEEAILIVTAKEVEHYRSKKLVGIMSRMLGVGYDDIKSYFLISNGKERTVTARKKSNASFDEIQKVIEEQEKTEQDNMTSVV
ncbi:hypothetical protein AKO1_010833 [Acrasis kona]|uniref:Ribosomal RNA methyltransferase FtsJ domain-containing protein n=1 Tax=Acrasis kona TaxID=1008807 RepID=A0AAW2YKT5_9EUKA